MGTELLVEQAGGDAWRPVRYAGKPLRGCLNVGEGGRPPRSGGSHTTGAAHIAFIPHITFTTTAVTSSFSPPSTGSNRASR